MGPQPATSPGPTVAYPLYRRRGSGANVTFARPPGRSQAARGGAAGTPSSVANLDDSCVLLLLACLVLQVARYAAL
ncbi:hypothetical protein F5B20DRAFT_580680 [Whalleya microplaca]|nr:hypothetical protein F5B20DRAFT_580680 [Whalleya microplaca]